MGDTEVGIIATDRANITNRGTITVGASGAYGIWATGDGLVGSDKTTITNSGTIIAGDGSFGIVVGTNYNVVNSGLITVGASGSAIQLAQDSAATNSGTIRVGTGGVAFDLNLGNNNTIVNAGSVYAPNGFSINGFSDGNTFTNTGYLQGTIVLIGNGPNSVTNQGYMIIGDPNAYAPGFAIVTSAGGGGQLINDPSGTLAVRVDPFSNDSFQADTVTLNGGRLQIVVTPGLYASTTTYSTASTGFAPVFSCGCNAIVGQFSTVVSSSPFFTATADYSTFAEVAVTLTRIAFGSVPGMTPNQRAVGTGLEGSYSTTLAGNAATFYGNLLAATSVTVLDQLSGEGTSAAQNAAFSAGSLFNNAMQNQALFGPNLNGLSAIAPTAYAAERVAPGHEAFAALKPPSAAEPGRFRVWTAGFGASQSLQGQADTGSASQSVRSAGGVLGFDWQAAPDLRVGLAVGGSELDLLGGEPLDQRADDGRSHRRLCDEDLGRLLRCRIAELCAARQLDDPYHHRHRPDRDGLGPLRQRPAQRAG